MIPRIILLINCWMKCCSYKTVEWQPKFCWKCDWWVAPGRFHTITYSSYININKWNHNYYKTEFLKTEFFKKTLILEHTVQQHSVYQEIYREEPYDEDNLLFTIGKQTVWRRSWKVNHKELVSGNRLSPRRINIINKII